MSLNAFDELFPRAGGLGHLLAVNKQETARDSGEVHDTCFTASEVKHLEKIFDFLADDEPARAMLAHMMSYCDMKSDVARREW